MGKTRSQQMASIRNRDTSPEKLLRQALWHAGIRYRVHYKTEVGRPDIVLTKVRLAIFVDGCQWHGCPQHYVRPRSNNAFWEKKLRVNFERDLRQTNELRNLGWSVLRIWEHEIFEDLKSVVEKIVLAISGVSTDGINCWRVVEVEVIDEESNLERRLLRLMNDPLEEKCLVQPRSTAKWKRNRVKD